MILHLHLVRHGQTYFNQLQPSAGMVNSPLTESGVADAVKAGERLKGLTFAAAHTGQHHVPSRRPRKFSTSTKPRVTAPALVTDMHFREQFPATRDLTWPCDRSTPRERPTASKPTTKSSRSSGWGPRDFLKEADPSTTRNPMRNIGRASKVRSVLLSRQPESQGRRRCAVDSHGNTPLSLGHWFSGPTSIWNERPANGLQPCDRLRHRQAVRRL